MFRIGVLLCMALWANAYDLQLQEGEIKAHTEVFGDSQINPTTKAIHSQLVIGDTVESIKGDISIEFVSLKSEKEDRDKNMHELINAKLFPNVVYTVKSITRFDTNYEIIGSLILNGITKEVISTALIEDKENVLNLNGNFSIKLTQFGMEPPSMFFVTVRDQIDITYNLTYKKEQ